MKRTLDSEQVIESLVSATLGEEASQRQKHIYRENLRSLVRLAKTEQVVEIKDNVRRLTGALEMHGARRRAKAVLLAQRLPAILASAQRKFEFE
jgi:hypothetical protein